MSSILTALAGPGCDSDFANIGYTALIFIISIPIIINLFPNELMINDYD